MLVTISLIVLITATTLPSVIGIFNAGADSQAYNIIAAQLRAARAHAIERGSYAGVHVQLGDPSANPKVAGACYSAVVAYDPNLPFPAFVLAKGFAPRRMPGGIAFGELSSDFVDPNGDYQHLDDADLDDFTAFTVVFSPSGSVVTMVDGLAIDFDPNELIFSGAAKQRLWDPNTANDDGDGEIGVTALTLFEYRMLEVSANRSRYLDENGQFLPVNIHTGQLFARK